MGHSQTRKCSGKSFTLKVMASFYFSGLVFFLGGVRKGGGGGCKMQGKRRKLESFCEVQEGENMFSRNSTSTA